MYRANFAEVPVVWRPYGEYGETMRKFKTIIEDKYDIELRDYWELYQWSIENLSEFWMEMWDFLGIVCFRKFDKVIDLTIPMSELPEWFPGARVNLAENLLRYRDERIALIVAGEDRETERITYAQMYQEARLYTAAFRKLGLKKGDTVVCQMSNRKEAVFAMEAVVSIGAIWAGALPLLGAQAVLNRFRNISPKMFITVDRFTNEGKEIDMIKKLEYIVEGLQTLEKVIIVASKERDPKKIGRIKNSCFLDDFLQLGYEKDGSVPQMKFEHVSSLHPVTINFTSGTTGMPKSIVHGWGGLLGTSKAYKMHYALDRSSVCLSCSPVGWASWHICTNIFALGATLALFEGVPYFLTPTHLWDIVDELQINFLFLPSSVIDEIQKRGYVPTSQHSLKSLKLMVAGGSVVKPQTYEFAYEKVRNDLPFTSGYGCTEFLGSCITIETSLPFYKGEIPAPSLGIAVEVVDDAGNSLVGEVGEFVITKPAPNLPLGFWGDNGGSEYRLKYFSKYPGKFLMNDYGILNPISKGYVVCCRSDETLKQRGTRFGSSEIYNVVDSFPEVRDSICVSHYNSSMDERAVLFLKIRDGYIFSDRLVSDIRSAIARELTVEHIPDIIIETKDIPYNINGKKLEIVVKKIINKMPYCEDTIRNPESLKNYINVPELRYAD